MWGIIMLFSHMAWENSLYIFGADVYAGVDAFPYEHHEHGEKSDDPRLEVRGHPLQDALHAGLHLGSRYSLGVGDGIELFFQPVAPLHLRDNAGRRLGQGSELLTSDQLYLAPDARANHAGERPAVESSIRANSGHVQRAANLKVVNRSPSKQQPYGPQ
jgi:hypothetical protein